MDNPMPSIIMPSKKGIQLPNPLNGPGIINATAAPKMTQRVVYLVINLTMDIQAALLRKTENSKNNSFF
jgi:hypothetical protein